MKAYRRALHLDGRVYSDRMKQVGPPRVALGVCVAVAWALAVVPLVANVLKPEAVAAFARYASLTEARLASERAPGASFLWMDRQPAAERARIEARLRAGEVVVEPMTTKDGGKTIEAPDALLHHWLATVFFPGASLDKTLKLLQSYDRYAEFFSPMIKQSRLRAKDVDRYDVQMRLYTKKVVTVELNVQNLIEYHPVDATHAWSVSRSVRIAELEGEREKPQDAMTGYLWRTNLYCHFFQRPDGTIEQCESVSLTRDIPWGFGWLIGPFVNSVPREALSFTLGRARAALMR